MAIGQGALEGLVVTPGFWRGRRVFLTGHTGFKGGWLALWLQQLGAQVTGFALPAEDAAGLFLQARVADGMTSIEGDVRDLDALASALARARPEVVFHLAAQALVRDSYAQPVETYATNVMGTVHLLEAVRRQGEVRAVVNVTSDKCYDNREWPWPYRETDALGGADPYSNSKACAELVTEAYRRSFFSAEATAGIATARAGNVIGGGDRARDRLIPDMVSAWSRSETLVLRHPHAVRPWQYVLEPLRGYLSLAETLHARGAEFGQAWNFGPRESDARPVQWLVEHLARAWPGEARWQVQAEGHPHEAGLLRIDASKAAARLGWRPALDLQQALEQTAHWYHQQSAGADMAAVSRQQLAWYQEKALHA